MRTEVVPAEGLDAIHATTLTLLDEVGVHVGLPEAVERFAGAGARAVTEGGGARVRIPSDLVDWGIAQAPAAVRYAGRDPRADFLPGQGGVGFATFGECLYVIDVRSGRRRAAIKADCAEVARVVDSLDALCVMERTLAPSDCPPATAPLHNLEAMLTNTGKHVFLGAGSRRDLEVMLKIGAAAAAGRTRFEERPSFTANVCPTSPLGLAAECCDVVIGAALSGVGLNVLPMSLSGATAPVTLAGALAQHHAEVLATLVLAQLTRPGTPVTYGSCSTIMDLRRAGAAVGAPEQALISSGVAALARRHGLPSWVGGGISDAKTADAQAGYEYALNAVVPALAGATVVYGAGALESGMTFDYGKLLLDCDAIASITLVLAGVAVAPEALALDVVAETGPYGSFLTHPHTLRLMRDQSRPRWFDRRSEAQWAAGGAEPCAERARRGALALMAEHTPMALPHGAADEIEGLIAEYEASCGLTRDAAARSV